MILQQHHVTVVNFKLSAHFFKKEEIDAISPLVFDTLILCIFAFCFYLHLTQHPYIPETDLLSICVHLSKAHMRDKYKNKKVHYLLLQTLRHKSTIHRQYTSIHHPSPHTSTLHKLYPWKENNSINHFIKCPTVTSVYVQVTEPLTGWRNNDRF